MLDAASRLLEREPGLEPGRLRGAALYYDAQVEFPERLAVENALSARDNGAVLITYAEVDRLVVEENVTRGVEFRDVLGGERHRARAAVMVNVGRAVGRPRAGRRARARPSAASAARREATSWSSASPAHPARPSTSRPRRTAGRSSSSRGTGST